METSPAENQTDSYFPTKWPNGYPKQRRCKRHTHIKNKPRQKNRLGTVSEKYFTGGLKSILPVGHIVTGNLKIITDSRIHSVTL